MEKLKDEKISQILYKFTQRLLNDKNGLPCRNYLGFKTKCNDHKTCEACWEKLFSAWESK